MNDRERHQLDLITKHELCLAQNALEKRIEAIFADHSRTADSIPARPSKFR
jgi:hypothetical protein